MYQAVIGRHLISNKFFSFTIFTTTMRSDFQFQNLLGTVYRNLNVVFTSDGKTLISPVGNRLSVFDLQNNTSYTMQYQHRKPIARVALNPQNTLLLSVDVDGRAILSNFRLRVVLHHFSFGLKLGSIGDLCFSPDGRVFAVATGRVLQIWKIVLSADDDVSDTYNDRQFAPFMRIRKHAGHHSDITCLSWSPDLRFILSGSKDMTTRVWSLLSSEKSVKTALAGHREQIVSAHFSADQESIYTLSKDGALLQWGYVPREESESESESEPETESPPAWRIVAKHYFFPPDNSHIKSAAFHPESSLLVAGLLNGEFRLYELPTFTLLQELSMGQNAVNCVQISSDGAWLAFGSKKLGQLLVYEWQSELYILKQQGHYDLLNAVCYMADGSRVATGGDDGKIKLWDVRSGFCIATLEAHEGAVTGLQMAQKRSVLFSCSLDGTVRAWDLLRYRNFRTYTAPSRVQFNSIALDPSGEVVVASAVGTYEIFVWSVQNGQLLDNLSGHEGPVSHVAFGVESLVLVLASWDKTIRVWDIFGRSLHVEPIQLYADVLAVAVSPNSKQIAVSTLDGQISFWDVESARQTGNIDCKKDVIAGRYTSDAFELKNLKRLRFFTTILYTFDGSALVCGGKNNSICLYDVNNEVLLRRFRVSENMMLDGTLEKLNSSRLTADGVNLDLIDRDGDNSDLEDRMDNSLPGSKRGDPSLRNTRAEVRVSAILFSPTANEFAAASTEGLLVFLVDQSAVFDPFDLDVDITPSAVLEKLHEKEYLAALVLSFRLNEQHLITQSIEAVPVKDMKVLLQEFPEAYVPQLLRFLGSYMLTSPHVEFNLIWLTAILSRFGPYIKANKRKLDSSIKTIQRFLTRAAKDVVKVGKENDFMYQFLSSTLGVGREVAPEADDVLVEVEKDVEMGGESSSETEGDWMG